MVDTLATAGASTDASKESKDSALAFEKTLRNGLSSVYRTIQASAVTESIAALSMEDLIAEAIYALDSEQIDLASQIESESSESAVVELGVLQTTMGRKQRLEALNTQMVGYTADDGTEVAGLIQRAKDYRELDFLDYEGEFAGVVSDPEAMEVQDNEGAALFHTEGQEEELVGSLSTKTGLGTPP
jgi:hypothetical protein